jgi:ABC-2 type transport system permease protein
LSANNIFAISSRLIRQLIRHRRTIALIVIVPIVVMSLISYALPTGGNTLDRYAPALIVTLALFFTFLLTGISFLRERSQGTLERLMASPISRLDMVLGYIFGFFVFALTQSLIILLFTIYALDISYAGGLWQIFIFLILIIIMAVCLGIFASAFAKNEFQMVQFIPLIIVPQIFLCGVVFPTGQMNGVLQWIGKFLPLTYGVDGMRQIMLPDPILSALKETWPILHGLGTDIGILIAFVIVMSILAAVGLRRGQSS